MIDRFGDSPLGYDLAGIADLPGRSLALAKPNL